MRQYDNIDNQNLSTMTIGNITDTPCEGSVIKEQDSVALKMILLVILFLISMVVNIMILLAFYKKQSLRTIRNRWVVTGISEMLSRGILYSESQELSQQHQQQQHVVIHCCNIFL